MPHLVAPGVPGPQDQRQLADGPRRRCPSRCAATPRTCPGSTCPRRAPIARSIEAALTAHDEALDDRRLVEERRLFYVALTRAEHVLLVSGHRWGPTGDRPRQPSVFLQEVRDEVETTGVGRVEHWAEEPEFGAHNPATAEPVTAEWPVDPLGARSAAVHAGAELVRAALREQAAAEPEPSGRSRGRPAGRRRPTPDDRREPATDPDPRAGPPTSTCSSPSAPPPGSAPGRRAARAAVGEQARRARRPTRAPSPRACAARCRCRRTRTPAAARPSTPGSSSGSAPPSCSTSTSCPAPRTRAPRRTSCSRSCRRRSWRRAGRSASRTRWRCRSRP